MAMNFWEAQRKARSKTKLYLFLFVFFTIIISVGVELSFRYFSEVSIENDHTASYQGNHQKMQTHQPHHMDEQGYDDQSIPYVGLIYALITFTVAGFNYAKYASYGGAVVAESCEGVLVSQNTINPKEKQLLNIVQEMSIAASLPNVPVYIIPSTGINAFAAGTKHSNAVIAVTRGSLDTLSRDELQGVIAHEFGHIYNGDMVVSMRLSAMTMGFLFILYFGLRLLQFSGGSRDDKKGNPILLAALIFIVAGSINWFLGSVLKSAVSREKEYLADACAVQFTRNPNGICGALKKIQLESKSTMPKQGSAFSHMYFDDHAGLSAIFATHPPLNKRIAAIEGNEYTPAEDLTKVPPTST